MACVSSGMLFGRPTPAALVETACQLPGTAGSCAGVSSDHASQSDSVINPAVRQGEKTGKGVPGYR